MIAVECTGCRRTARTTVEVLAQGPIPCRGRVGNGSRCPGTLVQPFTLTCIVCGATRTVTSTPTNPSVEIPCRACPTGRMA